MRRDGETEAYEGNDVSCDNGIAVMEVEFGVLTRVRREVCRADLS